MKNLFIYLLLIFLSFTVNAYCSTDKTASAQTNYEIKQIKEKLYAHDIKMDTLDNRFSRLNSLDKLRFNNVSKSILKRSNAILAISFFIALFVLIVTLYFNSLLNKNVNNINSSLKDTNHRLTKEIEELKAYIDEIKNS